METTYTQTLMSDFTFYTAVRHDDYNQVFKIASALHDAHHSDEGLTMADRYSSIVECIVQIQEGT